jgi:hypothetical protein
MRRVLWAVLFTAASLGIMAMPAGADIVAPNNLNPIVLSFDFSNNNQPASVSNGLFNITVDVLPEHTSGFVRVTADAPDGSGNTPVVCDYQQVQQSQVQCTFNFTASGLWSVKAQFVNSLKSDPQNVPENVPQIFAVTVLRVGN